MSAPLRSEWWRHGDRRAQALLLLLFIATRVALFGMGLRFKLDLSWMFLADLVDLRERLAETVFYFHAFAPGMNLLTGLLLKLAPTHVAALAAGLFWAFGALLTLCLFRMLRALGFGRGGALGLALGFSLLPQTLYLENLYLYNYLSAALLCLIAVLFQRALTRTSAPAWFWCFLVCTSLGWLYTAFHLLWFGLMLAFALLVAARGTRRRVWLGALAPALLLLALYVKNYAVFGVFGATSWSGANLTLATTQQMRPAERNRWIQTGQLSPYAGVNAYAPPSEYLWLFPELPIFPWPGTNELMRPSVNAGNFNHGLFLEVNRERAKDAAYYIETRPAEYLRRVFTQNLPSLFHATTHWHPHDRRPVSPHAGHRAVLGGYERLYDRLVHRWPVPDVGLFAFLPFFYAWALFRAITQLRSSEQGVRATGALLGLCLTQIAYVVMVSSMATSWEASRYRYSIEPCIWLIVALAVNSAYLRAKRRFGPGSRRAALPDTSGQIA